MIKEIDKELILNGLGQPVACCMFDTANRALNCDMWEQIYDEIGSIGYLVYEENRLVGQLIFLPKKYARKIGLSTCRSNDLLDDTLLIQCLFIHSDQRNNGYASMMIKKVIDFCKSKGYKRIEVSTCNRVAGREWVEPISFLPFRKFGFIMSEEELGYEFRTEDRMCFLNL
ncbi:MAG: GNAT family N-acetyltransferase [Dehalococcoidales bacterium]|nr:MAG: GNAT family N-acetyltransferase [Dehalococcoidales bacterium]